MSRPITHIAEHVAEGDTIRCLTTTGYYEGRVFRREIVDTPAGVKVDITLEMRHGIVRVTVPLLYPVTILERYAPPAKEAV